MKKECPSSTSLPILAEFLPSNLSEQIGLQRLAQTEIDLPPAINPGETIYSYLPFFALSLIAADLPESSNPEIVRKTTGSICCALALAKEVGEDKSIKKWPEIILNGIAGYAFGYAIAEAIQSFPQNWELNQIRAFFEPILFKAAIPFEYMRYTSNDLISWITWPVNLIKNKAGKINQKLQNEARENDEKLILSWYQTGIPRNIKRAEQLANQYDLTIKYDRRERKYFLTSSDSRSNH